MDTFDKTSEKHQRKLEREKRMAEINKSYVDVVTEAQEKHDNIYKNVFNEEGFGMDEADLLEMQRLAQFRQEQSRKNQGFLGRLLGSNAGSKDPMMPFMVQSNSAAGSLPAPPPASIDTPQRGGLPHGDQAKIEEFKKMLSEHSRSRTGILIFALFAIGLGIGIIMTAVDLTEIPASERSELHLIQKILMRQKIHTAPLYDKTSPQYQAALFIADEMVSGDLVYARSNLEEEPIFFEENGVMSSFNEAYRDQRLILERYVLMTLYKTLSGSNWSRSTNWMKKGLSVCDNWSGVSCGVLTEDGDNTVEVVTDIILNENELKGKIPDDLAHLYSLSTLHVAGNSLSGTVPTVLGELKSLTSLRISENDLTGYVPGSICALKSEKLVELESNCGGGDGQIECNCCTECI